MLPLQPSLQELRFTVCDILDLDVLVFRYRESTLNPVVSSTPHGSWIDLSLVTN